MTKKVIIAVVVVLLIAFCIWLWFAKPETTQNELPSQNEIDGIEVVNPNGVQEAKDKYVRMYENILEDLMKQKEEWNEKAEYIAIDVESLVSLEVSEELKEEVHNPPLEESEVTEIVEFLKQYGKPVKEITYEQLKVEENATDESVLKGIFISAIKVNKISVNKYKIAMRKYKSPDEAVFLNYTMTYRNGIWKMEVESVSI